MTEPAPRDPADSAAIPPYIRELIRQHREKGVATPEWEARIALRVAAIEAVLDDGDG